MIFIDNIRHVYKGLFSHSGKWSQTFIYYCIKVIFLKCYATIWNSSSFFKIPDVIFYVFILYWLYLRCKMEIYLRSRNTWHGDNVMDHWHHHHQSMCVLSCACIYIQTCSSHQSADRLLDCGLCEAADPPPTPFPVCSPVPDSYVPSSTLSCSPGLCAPSQQSE